MTPKRPRPPIAAQYSDKCPGHIQWFGSAGKARRLVRVCSFPILSIVRVTEFLGPHGDGSPRHFFFDTETCVPEFSHSFGDIVGARRLNQRVALLFRPSNKV